MGFTGKRQFPVRRQPIVVDVGCSCRRMRSLSSVFTTNNGRTASRRPKFNPQTPPNLALKHRHPLSSYYPFSPSTTTFSTSRNLSSSSTATSLYEDDQFFSSSPNWITPTRTATATATATAKPVKPPSSVKSKKKPSLSTGAAKRRVVKESVAVVKESEDPYYDFKDSMLQMILEKEIYAWEDLRELLQRFLSLNSPYQHDSIMRAFTEIWNDIFAAGNFSRAHMQYGM
ncbi:Ovate family protein [Zostera marina]|uniref:Transcription repressor n=1 Tax=Zostera marina TaxID=29655 RepID=A0A0K9NWE7_ZOSMR|nr:Ovate family protein [Zostera marina]